jgi:hypothetical protein
LCSRGVNGAVGAVPPRWELGGGGHRGAVVAHRRGKGRARAGQPGLLGRTEGAGRAREREEKRGRVQAASVCDWAAAVCWAEHR